jgi:hypothetical protein
MEEKQKAAFIHSVQKPILWAFDHNLWARSLAQYGRDGKAARKRLGT